jgi:hypothetical protein
MVVKNSPLRHKPLNRDDDLVTYSSYAQGYPPSWWIQECKGNIFRSDAAIVPRGTVPPTRTARHTKAGQLCGWLGARLARLAHPLDRSERVNRRRLDLIGEGQHVLGKPRVTLRGLRRQGEASGCGQPPMLYKVGETEHGDRLRRFPLI